MNQESQIVKTEQKTQIPKTPIAIGRNGLELASMDDLFRFSSAVSVSGFAPKGMEKPESIFVAVQLGLEIGLSPMSALQNIGVINGRPGIYGDAALALVRASGLLESYSEKMVGDGENRKCVVKSLRAGSNEPMESEFSVADAKRAQLWGKQGPWTQYPERMLKFRARGFNLRDNFGDVLKGLRTTEELQDIPEEPRNITPKVGFVSQTEEKAPALPEPIKSDPVPESPKAENPSGDDVYKRFGGHCDKEGVSPFDLPAALRKLGRKVPSKCNDWKEILENEVEWATENFTQVFPHLGAA